MTRSWPRPARVCLLKGFGREQSGATALEFAIVFPAVAMLLFGTFNVGMAFYSGAAVRSAVQRASRTLILNPNTSASDLRTTALDLMVSVPVQDFAVVVTQETISTATVKRVSWTYNYPLSLPLVPTNMLGFSSSLVTPIG